MNNSSYIKGNQANICVAWWISQTLRTAPDRRILVATESSEDLFLILKLGVLESFWRLLTLASFSISSDDMEKEVKVNKCQNDFKNPRFNVKHRHHKKRSRYVCSESWFPNLSSVTLHVCFFYVWKIHDGSINQHNR